MAKKKKKPEPPWAVVCTDFHQVIGPYSQKEAVEQASRLTAEGDCVHLPVRLTLTKPLASSDEEARKKHPGQYL